MPDVQIQGTDTTVSFPDTMSQDDIAKVMSTHPMVQQLRAKSQSAATSPTSTNGPTTPNVPKPVTPAYMQPDPAIEQPVQKYIGTWLGSTGNNTTKPYQLMLQAAQKPEASRQSFLDSIKDENGKGLSTVGKLAILRAAYNHAGSGTASPQAVAQLKQATVQPPAPSLLQKAGSAVGGAFQSAVQPFTMGGNTAPTNVMQPLNELDQRLTNMAAHVGTQGARDAAHARIAAVRKAAPYASSEAQGIMAGQQADPNFLANFAPGVASAVRKVPAVGGAADFITGLATPGNVVAMMTMGAANKIGAAGTGTVTPVAKAIQTGAKVAEKTAAAGFGAGMAKGGGEQLVQAGKDIQQKGFHTENVNEAVKGFLSLAASGLAVNHLVKSAQAGAFVNSFDKQGSAVLPDAKSAQLAVKTLKAAGRDVPQVIMQPDGSVILSNPIEGVKPNSLGMDIAPKSDVPVPVEASKVTKGAKVKAAQKIATNKAPVTAVVPQPVQTPAEVSTPAANQAVEPTAAPPVVPSVTPAPTPQNVAVPPAEPAVPASAPSALDAHLAEMEAVARQRIAATQPSAPENTTASNTTALPETPAKPTPMPFVATHTYQMEPNGPQVPVELRGQQTKTFVRAVTEDGTKVNIPRAKLQELPQPQGEPNVTNGQASIRPSDAGRETQSIPVTNSQVPLGGGQGSGNSTVQPPTIPSTESGANTGRSTAAIPETGNVSNAGVEPKPVSGQQALPLDVPATEPGKPSLRDKLSESADAARDRIKKSGGQANTFADPRLIKDLAVVAADNILKGVDWTSEFIKSHGETIRPHLAEIETQARGLIEQYKAANKTARAAGSVGERAVTPKWVQETAKPTESILDFGSGDKASHTMRLRGEGLNVTAHEFATNVREGIHDPNALNRKYDTVFASNVLNTQGSAVMLRGTLDQIAKSVNPGGRAVLNLPAEPRYEAWDGVTKGGQRVPTATLKQDAARLQSELEKRFKTVERVGGTAAAPLFEARNPFGERSSSSDVVKPSLKDKVNAKLDAVEKQAQDSIKSSQGKTTSGVDPRNLADLAIIGAVKIARGAVKIADFSHQMVTEFGDAIKPHLNDLYAAAKDHYHSEIAPKFNLPRVPEENRTSPILSEQSSSGPPGTRGLSDTVSIPKTSDLPNSSKTGADLPKTVEVKPTGETPSDVIMSPESTAKTKGANAHAAEERTKIGLEDLPQTERRPVADAFNEATKNHASASARVMAEGVLKNPRPLTDVETAGLVQRMQEGKQRVEALRSLISKSVEKGETGSKVDDLRAEHNSLLDEYDTLDKARKEAGRQWALSGLARQIEINDYDYTGVRQRAITANPRKPLTPQEDTRIGNLTDALKAANDKIAQHEQTIKDQVAQRSVQRMIRENAQETRRTGRAKAKADLDTEFDQLRKQFVKAGSQLNSGIPAELIPIVAKMAKNRVAAGINTIDGLVDNIHEALKDHVEGITTRDIRDAISGYGQTVSQGTRSEAVKNLAEMQKQMRLISAIEDAEKGQQPAKGQAPGKPSAQVAKLRAQLDETMQKQGLKSSGVSDEARLNSAKSQVKAKIDDLTRRINEKDFSKIGTNPVPADAELTKLKADRDALQKQYEGMKPNPEKTPQQRTAPTMEARQNALKSSLEKRIADLDRRMKAGDFSQNKPDDVQLTKELYKLKSQRDRLQARYDAAKPATVKTPDADAAQKKLAATIARTQARINDLQRQADAGKVDAKQPATGEKLPPSSDLYKLQKQRDALQSRVDALRPKADPLPAIKTRLAKQIADMREQLKTNNFDKPEKPASPVYDEEASKLRLTRDKLKLQIDNEIRNREAKSGLTFASNLTRAFKLSGVNVFAKLGGATGWAVPVEAVSDLFGAGFGKILKVKGQKLGDVASREGVFMPQADLAGVRTMFSRDAVRNAYDTIRQGFNDIDVLSGKEEPHGSSATDTPGRLHGSSKAFLQSGQFRKSSMIRLWKAAKQGRDINNPDVQAEIGMNAALDAQDAILKGDNKLATKMNQAMGVFERDPNKGAQAVGLFLRTLFPIVKVPSNYLGKAVDMTGVGIGRGIYEQVKAAREPGELTPAQADKILKAYKRGGMGLVAAYLGIAQPKGFQTAGFFANGAKPPLDKDGKPMQFSDVEIAGHHVPHVFAHNSFIEAVQFWATVSRVLRQTKETDNLSKAGEVLAQAGGGLLRQAPGLQTAGDTANMLTGGRGAGQAAGMYVRGNIIPQILQEGAKMLDKDAQGNVVPRDKSSFRKAIQEGVPLMRNKLPVKGAKSGGGGRSSDKTETADQMTNRLRREAMGRK